MHLLSDFNLHLIPTALKSFIKLYLLAAVLLLLLARPLRPAYLWLETTLQKNQRYYYLIGGIAVIAIGYYLVTDILMYRNFDTYLYDYGFFYQVAWVSAHLGSQTITVGLPKPIPHWLGDHFQPIMYLVGLLYALVSTPYTLFGIEVVSVVSGLIPLVLLCKKYTASALLTTSLALAYIATPSTFYALEFSFHPFTLLPPLLLWIFYFTEQEEWWWYAVAIILALSTKEDVGYYLACYGVWLVVCGKRKDIGLATAVGGFLWSWVAIHYAMPYFRQGPIIQFFTLTPLLTSSGGILRTSISHPGIWPQVLTNTSSKWETWLTSFGSFGFLPLFNPLFIPIYPMLMERFLSTNPNYWEIVYQYGAPLGATLTYMTLQVVGTLNRRYPNLEVVWPVLIICGLVGSSLGAGVQLTHFSAELQQLSSPRTVRLAHAEASIPANASVCSQDELSTHLADRASLYFLSDVYTKPPRCTYVALDDTLQSYPLASAIQVDQLAKRLSQDPDFKLRYSSGPTMVWQRITPTSS